jgi:putative hydroxymethylpyrimidine transport system substrate-binding protein
VTRLVPLVLCCAALVLAACGEREDPGPGARSGPDRVSVMLDYFPNADHAGLYAAMDGGAFDEVKLEVEARTPADPAEPLRLLEAGRVDLAISYEPEVMLARDRGAKLIAIGALVQKPLTSIISIGKNPIRRAEDLAGKRIGTAGIPYQSAYLQTILDRSGIEPGRVKEVGVGFNLVPNLLSKKVDAVLGGFWNYEGIQLQRMHKRPQIIRMENAGVPTYNELVFVATDATVRKRGELLRRFVQAVQSGARAVQADPAAGVDPLVAASKDLDRPLQLAAVKATLPVFFPEDDDRPYGYQDPQEWEAYGEWMRANKLITRPPTSAAFTNEFLPGEGGRASESTPANADTP